MRHICEGLALWTLMTSLIELSGHIAPRCDPSVFGNLVSTCSIFYLVPTVSRICKMFPPLTLCPFLLNEYLHKSSRLFRTKAPENVHRLLREDRSVEKNSFMNIFRSITAENHVINFQLRDQIGTTHSRTRWNITENVLKKWTGITKSIITIATAVFLCRVCTFEGRGPLSDIGVSNVRFWGPELCARRQLIAIVL